MAMPTLKRRWTVADLDDLPDDGNRYEIIDGELYVTPAPAWAHQRAIGELFKALDEYVERTKVGYAYFAPADVIFTPSRAVQPDLFVVPRMPRSRPKQFADVGRLLLAVEVLSPSSARADRVAKRALYRDERVGEYWLVDLDSRIVERSTPSDPRVDIVAERLEWRPGDAAEPLAVDLPTYFSSVLDN